MKNLIFKSESNNSEVFIPEDNVWLTRVTIGVFIVILNICVFSI